MHRLVPIPPLILCLGIVLAACDAARTDAPETAPPEPGCAHSAAGTWEALSPASIEAERLRLYEPYLYAVGYDEGLWRRDLRDTSAAGGAWTYHGLPEDSDLGILGVLDVWQDPLDPQRMLAAARPDSYLGPDRSSAFRTADGGATWEDVSGGLPLLFGHRIALCRLFEEAAGEVVALGGGYALRTGDLGETWETLNEYVPGGPRPLCSYYELNPIERSGADPGAYWTGVTSGAYTPVVTHSLDAGHTWAFASPPLAGDAAPVAIALDPFEPNTVYLALGWIEAILKSVDNGATWSALSTAGIDDISGDLLADPGQQGRVWLGPTTRYGHVFHLYLSEKGGGTWTEVEVDDAIVDPSTSIADLEWDEREGALLLGTDRGVYRYRPAVDTSVECGP